MNIFLGTRFYYPQTIKVPTVLTTFGNTQEDHLKILHILLWMDE